jgi:wyosine [tRNA(Phe)-imidazoG37] synthetase (radical SAM superfamily)
MYSHLFGPVVSRRLGISLGVDIVPQKVCSLDCVYCECGPTTRLTDERKEWVRTADVISELRGFLAGSPALDVVTLTGSGEPTLNTGLGDVISFLKRYFPLYKTALLTNGTLLWLPDVASACLQFDYVLPSLDAVSGGVFTKVNRPLPGLDNNKIIRGLAEFSRRYTGNLWLEVFIVPAVNDSEEELDFLREAIVLINPGRVQLNTLDRPGTDPSIRPSTPEELAKIAAFFQPLPVEIISRGYPPTIAQPAAPDLLSMIAATVRRRPSTVEDLSMATGKTINEITAVLSGLLNDGTIIPESVKNRVFYKIVK